MQLGDDERLSKIEVSIEKLQIQISTLEDRVNQLQNSFYEIASHLTKSLVTNSDQFSEMTRMTNLLAQKLAELEVWKTKIVSSGTSRTSGMSNYLERMESNLKLTVRALEQYFNEEELNVIIIDLGEKPTDFKGTHSLRVRELVQESIRKGSFWELVRLARIQRPKALWPTDTGKLSG